MQTLICSILLDRWLSWCFRFLLIQPCMLFVLVMIVLNVDVPNTNRSGGLLMWAMTKY